MRINHCKSKAKNISLILAISLCPSALSDNIENEGQIGRAGTYLDKLPSEEFETFDRLFTTTEQRRFLDRKRLNGDTGDNVELITNNPKTSVDNVIEKPEVRLSGVLLREDGRNMVWVNGQSELSTRQDKTVKANKPKSGSISVSVHSQQRSARLKPGQVWLLDQRRVEESYKVKKMMSIDNKPIDDISNDSDENILDSEVNDAQ